MHSLHHLFGVLLNGTYFSPISFTNWFNLLFISGWTHRYNFILWVITPYYFTYLVHIVAALAIGSSLSWLLYLLIYFHYCDFLFVCFLVWRLPYSPVWKDALESSCILPVLVLNWTFSHTFCSFYWIMVLEANFKAVGMLTAISCHYF